MNRVCLSEWLRALVCVDVHGWASAVAEGDLLGQTFSMDKRHFSAFRRFLFQRRPSGVPVLCNWESLLSSEPP